MQELLNCEEDIGCIRSRLFHILEALGEDKSRPEESLTVKQVKVEEI